jgi:hypothetical protein
MCGLRVRARSWCVLHPYPAARTAGHVCVRVRVYERVHPDHATYGRRRRQLGEGGAHLRHVGEERAPLVRVLRVHLRRCALELGSVL